MTPARQALFTAAAMILIAVLVLFALPAPTDDSERAFRLVIAVAAIFAALLKWRRARRAARDDTD